MGHGDTIVIADANFPSDSTALHTAIKEPLRVHGSTAAILSDILKLMPLDQYVPQPLCMMDRVPSDKDRGLLVPAYAAVAEVSGLELQDANFVERFEFYERAKRCFAVIQTDDRSLYANIIISKGVL